MGPITERPKWFVNSTPFGSIRSGPFTAFARLTCGPPVSIKRLELLLVRTDPGGTHIAMGPHEYLTHAGILPQISTTAPTVKTTASPNAAQGSDMTLLKDRTEK